GDADAIEALRAALRRPAGPIAFTSEQSESDDLAEVRVEVARPDGPLRAAAWRVELEAAGASLPPAEVERFAAELPIGRPAIAVAVGLAVATGGDLAAFERAARAQVHSQLARYAERTVPRARLSDLVLTADLL